MKTLVKLGMAMLAMIAFAGCGSNKQATTSNQPQPIVVTTPSSADDPDVAAMDKQIALAKKQKELDRVRDEHQTSIDPCGEYFDDMDYYRDYGLATSLNKASAQSMSIDVAKENIRKHMAEFVQAMGTSYRNLYAGSNPNDDIQRKIEGRMLQTVEVMMNSAEKLCQVYEIDTRGNYVYYAAFQVSKKDFKKELTEDLNQLSKEEKLDIDFREQRFQKMMDERFEEQMEARRKVGY